MTVLAVVILLVGCSQAVPSVEKQQKNREAPERIEKAPPRDPSPDLPAYDITMQQDCAETGVVGKCYGVSTDATSREELEVVTADLWLDSPGYLAVLVTFYPNKPTADVSAAGFAFENEQAARVVLAQFLAQGSSVEDEVREAMANSGIYVVAPADEARELTQNTAMGRATEAPAGRPTEDDTRICRVGSGFVRHGVKACGREVVSFARSVRPSRFVHLLPNRVLHFVRKGPQDADVSVT